MNKFFVGIFIVLLLISSGCKKGYIEDAESDSRYLSYGGWNSCSSNIRLKMIMNHLGIKEDDFIIHRCGCAIQYNDIVHKKNETCKYCLESKKKDIKYHDIR